MKPTVARAKRTVRRGEMVAAVDRDRVRGTFDVAVARLVSGRLVVVEDVCPHDGGRISDGFVDGELLVCTRHNWELTPCEDGLVRACKLRE
ncbi:MAG: Rieske 2Fe-2S domain-containing protein [Proteobacteria bacterium]|nr:Rieske 2Fe-2S domain-containing protein [Pseudomonadota bacterium]